MPRPKVHPSQRRRAAEACSSCRATKKRCSGIVPCMNCIHKGKAASCYMPPKGQLAPELAPAPAAGAAATTTTAGAAATTAAGAAASISPSGFSPNSHFTSLAPDLMEFANRPTSRDAGPAIREASVSTTDATGVSAVQHHRNSLSFSPTRPQLMPHGQSTSTKRDKGPQPRMLFNSRGEKVYIGGAASISFLQLVRETVFSCIGPSQFSHSLTRDSMLETQSQMSECPPVETLAAGLSPEDKQSFWDVYLSASGGLLDIFLPAEIDEILRAPQRDAVLNISPYQQASIDLVMAIGAQCSSNSNFQAMRRSYFLRAQQVAFASMLEDPSIDMVRVFLLMSFYMLGECRRNAAYMHLGVAARAASALGLHVHDSYTDMNNPKHQLALRIWMSLWVMDNLSSSILGRPSCTPAMSSGMDDIINSYDLSREHSLSCLVASYRIVRIISNTVEKLYGKRTVSSKAVEDLLDKIEAWRCSMPPDFWDIASQSQLLPRESLAALHVSSLYYFAVTLITRQFLVSTITAPTDNPVHSQFSAACVDAAVYMTETCYCVLQNKVMLSQMCIMKALVFAAGLILGVSLFAKQEVDYENESAFQHAKEVLEFLAIQSPQAGHYSEILSLLTNAISKQRQNLASKGRKSKHVKRLFAINQGDSGKAPDAASTELTNSVNQQNFDISSLGVQSQILAEEVTPPHETPSFLLGTDLEGDAFLGWDSVDVWQWDNFQFMGSQPMATNETAKEDFKGELMSRSF